VRRTLVLITVLSVARVASASPVDVFGFGSRQAGMGGAVAATVDDFSAGYYDPAGLAFGHGKRVSFGFLGARSHLHVNDDAYPITEPLGLVFGASTPAPLGGPLADRVYVGIGMVLLPTTIIRVIARLPSEPLYPYYDNRTQRLVVMPVIAAKITNHLAAGIGINVLAGLGGQVVANEGPTRALDARVDEQIPTIARVNAGLRWDVNRFYSAALVYRQKFSVPFSTIANNSVAGEPIDLAIHAEGLFTPDQIVAGNAFHTDVADVTFDLTWARWSAYPGPYVQVTSELPLVGPLAGVLPKVPWSDTIGARIGVERANLALSGDATFDVRAGYGFETSPVPASQPGVTNLLDGPKHTISAGVGFRFPLAHKRWIRIDLHAQAQIVGARTMHKIVAPPGQNPAPFDGLRDEVTDDPSDPSTLGSQISNPGYPSISSGGQVFSGGMTVEVAL
jgi:long-chain fatty acid transport protein